MATTRSANPIEVHRYAGALTRAPNRAIDHASGSAVTPAKMSPHPALGANGAGSRPSAKRITKLTPSTRIALTATSAGNGVASIAFRIEGTAKNAQTSAATGSATGRPNA